MSRAGRTYGTRASFGAGASEDPFGVGWSRTRLLAVVSFVVVLGLLVGAGIVIAFSGGPPNHVSNDQGSGTHDGKASAGSQSMQPSATGRGAEGPSTLVVPAGTSLGPAGVPSGFPPTAAGALGQLIALDQLALQSNSVPTAQAVVRAWSAPEGPTADSWSVVAAVADLAAASAGPAAATSGLTVQVAPVLGLLRDVPAPGTAEPCVVYIVTATVPASPAQRVAVADCQRMVWQEGRWVLGPGEEPPASPSVWPGTRAAQEAGYSRLVFGP